MARKVGIGGDRRYNLMSRAALSRFWSEQAGLPPITGRIIGWLMISDSAEQAAR